MNSGLPERRPRDGGRGRLRHFPRRAQPGHQAAGEEGEKNSRLIFFKKKKKLDSNKTEKSVFALKKNCCNRKCVFFWLSVPENRTIAPNTTNCLVQKKSKKLNFFNFKKQLFQNFQMWIFRYKKTKAEGNTFMLPFLGAVASTWREILRGYSGTLKGMVESYRDRLSLNK